MTRALLIICVLVSLSACTAVRVQPVSPSAQMLHVCIQENPKVLVEDFIPVIRQGFDRHGVSTELVQANATPTRCEYVMTYTALRSWDLAPYLSHAELRIERRGDVVASAQYYLRGKGGYSLMKWQGTKAKMDPVIDELLAPKSRSAKAESKDVTRVLPKVTAASDAQPMATEAKADIDIQTTEGRLRELQRLKDQGLISEDEYNEKRKAVLSEI